MSKLSGAKGGWIRYIWKKNAQLKVSFLTALPEKVKKNTIIF